jgi:hypothetical protein
VTATRRALFRRAAAAGLISASTASAAELVPAGFDQIAKGPFKPTWESLDSGYRTPDWFRDAKFGLGPIGALSACRKPEIGRGQRHVQRGKQKPFTPRDIRFTAKGGAPYAITLGGRRAARSWSPLSPRWVAMPNARRDA